MSMSQYKPKKEPIQFPISPQQSRIKVKAGDKWILIGTSGSGKTTALKYLDNAYVKLFPAMRHYIFDSKFDGDFDTWPGRVQSDMAPGRPPGNQRYQVWQPIHLYPEQIEKWLWQVRHDAPAILEIDELAHLVYKANGEYSKEFNDILKTGRSLPVGVISLTQELSKIPANTYKQSNHRLGFYVDQASRYDRQIRDALLKAKVADPADTYGMYYQHVNGRGEPLYFPTVQKFLGVQ